MRPLFDLRADLDVPERGRMLSCVSCGLYKDVLTPMMPAYGENRRRVMLVGEAPGETEDKRGKPWQGRAGQLLQRALRELGFDLAHDCVSLNACACRPPNNREPTGHEIACCRVKIVNPSLARYAPKVIMLMGGSAVASVLGPLCAGALGDSIGKWRGFTIPFSDLGAWICPTYHPSYVMREEKRPEIATVWRRDVERGLGKLNTSVPSPEDLRGKVKTLHREDDILRAIRDAHAAELLSFDYETTGLHPALHKIICASFATSSDRAIAFMMPEEGGSIREAWRELMANPDVGKISHNMRFEDSWTREHFNVGDINWVWDSMIAAHVVDNRVGICGLKLQAFLNFGVLSWDEVIDPYLKPVDSKNPASPNRLAEFIGRYGEDDCLVYCAIDSLLSYRLARKQRVDLGLNT